MAEMDGPCYLRLSRPATPIVCPEDYQFQIGKASVFRPGNDVTIMATGIMVAMALEAAEVPCPGIDRGPRRERVDAQAV